MSVNKDTVFALSSAQGRAALSVIRISGERAFLIVEKLTKNKIKKFEHQKSIPSNIYNKNNNLIDKVVLSFYCSPNSYTGENLVEITTHGNPIIVDNLFNTLLDLGLRLANPGEFTNRAYHNEKIDLVQAESILATINAISKTGVKSSLLGVVGKLSNRLEKIKQLLVISLGELEYELDISEVDNRDLVIEKSKESIKKVIGDMKKLIKSHNKASILTDGAKIVIIGAPNVGKSTLLNTLIKRDRSIVTNTPGTTRDTIETLTSFSNYPALLIDTAGIRKTKNQIEIAGIKKTENEIKSSDIIFNIQSNTKKENVETDPTKTIKIFNKSDLMTEQEKNNIQNNNPTCVIISAKTKRGIKELRSKTEKLLKKKTESTEPLFLSSKRQQTALKESKKHLKKALKKESLFELEIIAHNLRLALNEFDWVLGKTSTDNILESVFSKFCVGK
tara:strand:- start:10477 stop:11817 length:1341 start_codon:yes stop_codon:yes gene_type:complete